MPPLWGSVGEDDTDRNSVGKIGAIGATFMGLFSKRKLEPISPEQFWDWFKMNASRLETLPPDRRAAKELTEMLERVDGEMVWQLGPRSLEISADGISEVAPRVRRLVAAAPSVPGWTIFAFRQPTEGASINIGGLTISPQTTRFTHSWGSDMLYLVLYLPIDNPKQKDAAIHGAFVLLDALLGEETMMIRVGNIDFAPIRSAPEESLPLRELPSVLAAGGAQGH